MRKFYTMDYTDMGAGSERMIILSATDEEGRVFCVGSVFIDETLCPCCMTPETRSRLMELIRHSGVTRIIWKSPYAHAVEDYFPRLYPAGGAGEFLVK